MGIITEIKGFSIHDGPGIRTTVFAKGCPLRCKWCCNPETQKLQPEVWFIAKRCGECGDCVKVCPEGAVSMDKENKIDRAKCTQCMKCVEACRNRALEKIGMGITPEDLAEKVKKDLPFFVRSGGGVTVTGGEPLFQPDFVSRLFELCHQNKISTVLDTCACTRPDILERVLKHTDMVLLDLKIMSPEEHKKWTGVSNELILENARIIAKKTPVRVTFAVIPGANDSEENIRQTIEFTKSLGIKHIDVLPFHRLGASKYQYLGRESPFSDFDDPSEEKVKEVLDMIKSCGLEATNRRLI